MKKTIISQKKYQCLACFELFDTAQEARNCQKIDLMDGFSKLSAWLSKQRNFENSKKGG